MLLIILTLSVCGRHEKKAYRINCNNIGYRIRDFKKLDM